MNIITYKDYTGKFDYHEDDDIFHGEVLGIRDVLTFEGRSIDELKQALRDTIEDYREWCEERGTTPQKPRSGKFVVRVDPDIHNAVIVAAAKEGKSLNAWVAEVLGQAAKGR